MGSTTKEKILDAALVSFAENGYKGTNLRDLAACGIVAVQFIALLLIAIYIGIRGTSHESNRYPAIGLGLTCVANFMNIAMQKRRAS